MDAHVRQLETEHDRHLHRSFLMAIELGRAEAPGPGVRAQLTELADGLGEHMAIEEENLFPWLVDLLPHRSEVVASLARQHVDLARMLSTLEHAQLPPNEPVPRHFIEVAKQFVRLLDSHSQVERDLLIEAVAVKRARESAENF